MSNDMRSIGCVECGDHAVWIEADVGATAFEGAQVSQWECECQCDCDGKLDVRDDGEQCQIVFVPNDFPLEVYVVNVISYPARLRDREMAFRVSLCDPFQLT